MVKKLKVIKIDKYDYILEDSDNKKYNYNMEFLDCKIEVGDYIYISEKILNDNMLTFGTLRDDKSSTEDDLIKIIHGDNEFYLMRYYG